MFTATVKLQQRRDIRTGVPKTLFCDIQHQGQEFRDHSWVEETHTIARLRRESRRDIIKVKFDGDLRGYRNHRTGEMKTTIVNIRNIEVIR